MARTRSGLHVPGPPRIIRPGLAIPGVVIPPPTSSITLVGATSHGVDNTGNPAALPSVPVGTTTDDFLLALVGYSSVITPTNDEVGWTELGNISLGGTGTDIMFSAKWRWATASEPASYGFRDTVGTGDRTAILASFRGVNTGAPFDGPSGQAQGSASVFANAPAPSRTASVDGCLYVGMWEQLFCLGQTIPGGNMVLAHSAGFSGSDPCLRLGIEAVNAGATGTRTATIGNCGSGKSVAWSILLRPI